VHPPQVLPLPRSRFLTLRTDAKELLSAVRRETLDPLHTRPCRLAGVFSRRCRLVKSSTVGFTTDALAAPRAERPGKHPPNSLLSPTDQPVSLAACILFTRRCLIRRKLDFPRDPPRCSESDSSAFDEGKSLRGNFRVASEIKFKLDFVISLGKNRLSFFGLNDTFPRCNYVAFSISGLRNVTIKYTPLLESRKAGSAVVCSRNECRRDLYRAGNRVE